MRNTILNLLSMITITDADQRETNLGSWESEMIRFKMRIKKRSYNVICRRRGVVAFYAAMTTVILLAMTGFAVDTSRLYLQRTKAQRAADAASLAGAIHMMKGDRRDQADQAARDIAKANGYDVDQGATVNIAYPAPGSSSHYNVTVSKQEPLYFMPVIGLRSKPVGASAASTFESPVNISTSGVGTYGAEGPMNLSLYGPYAAKQHGDAYSPMFMDIQSAQYTPGLRHGDRNPDYTPTGYDFHIEFQPNYLTTNNNNSRVVVEIFDPDSYNNGGFNANGTDRVDEIRLSPHGNYPILTTTVFTLSYTNGTMDTRDDILLATETYRADPATDMRWVQPPGFSFDLNDPRWQGKALNTNMFRINARATDGSSENGFLLRAGPQRTDGTEFNTANGTDITAQGRIPINFNNSGVVRVKLGHIPANSTSFFIDKFDTDVGAQSITYSDGAYTFNGTLAANAQHRRDNFQLPSGYGGGVWYATYTAGQQDTSSWSMGYVGPSNGAPGSVRLVR